MPPGPRDNRDWQESRGRPSREARNARRAQDREVQERAHWRQWGWVPGDEWARSYWKEVGGEWVWGDHDAPPPPQVQEGSHRWRRMKEMERKLSIDQQNIMQAQTDLLRTQDQVSEHMLSMQETMARQQREIEMGRADLRDRWRQMEQREEEDMRRAMELSRRMDALEERHLSSGAASSSSAGPGLQHSLPPPQRHDDDDGEGEDEDDDDDTETVRSSSESPPGPRSWSRVGHSKWAKSAPKDKGRKRVKKKKVLGTLREDDEDSQATPYDPPIDFMTVQELIDAPTHMQQQKRQERPDSDFQ